MEQNNDFLGKINFTSCFSAILIRTLDRKINAFGGIYCFQHSHYFRNIITFEFLVFAKMMFCIILFPLLNPYLNLLKNIVTSAMYSRKLINV